MHDTNSQTTNIRGLLGYFSPLTLLVYFAMPHGYFLDIATTFMLKDQLNADPVQVSTFRLLTAIPIYFSAAFGLTRDLWNPFGRRDSAYFMIFAPLTAIIYFYLASKEITYNSLFLGVFFAMFFFRFISASYQGLVALLGQEQMVSGRLAALWQIVSSVPYILGGYYGGWVSEHLSPQQTFLILGIISLFFLVFGFWRPKAVFAHTYDQPLAKPKDFVNSIKALFSHKPIYPAILMMLLFQFAPAANTPLQFYLANKLHASDEIYGQYLSVFNIAFLPAYFIYAWLCSRVNLQKLLFWGCIITIPQMIPILFISEPQHAVWAAIPMGMMGGIAWMAIYDLTIRSCPPGLQGALMMLVEGANYFAVRGGDLIGANIYKSNPENGFLYSVLATVGVYCLLLVVYQFVPKDLISSKDGEKNKYIAAENI